MKRVNFVRNVSSIIERLCQSTNVYNHGISKYKSVEGNDYYSIFLKVDDDGICFRDIITLSLGNKSSLKYMISSSDTMCSVDLTPDETENLIELCEKLTKSCEKNLDLHIENLAEISDDFNP